MKANRLIYFISLISLCLGLLSCSDCTFESENLQIIRLTFNDKETYEVIDTSFTAIYGLGIDEAFYTEDQGSFEILELDGGGTPNSIAPMDEPKKPRK